jgi:FMN phosphatase YigB (HAD superfamily)
MKLILLMDLDGTLLGNNTDQFIREYFKLFGQFFSSLFPQEKVLHELKSGTAKMISNADPQKTLEKVFDDSFFPALSLTKDQLKPQINRFYAEAFPQLKKFTELRPEAVQLVEFALKRHYDIIIATNPLFPRTAIEQRLQWAGLPVDRYPFKLITTYETFHFAKPNPAYYAEILCDLGWPGTPIVMAGNDPEMDIIPARTVGMMTYLVTELGDQPSNPVSDRAGSLKEMPEWLEMKEEGQSLSVSKQPKAIISALQASLAVLPTNGNHLSGNADLFVKNELDLLAALRQITKNTDALPSTASFSMEFFYQLRAFSIRLLKSIPEDQLVSTPVPGGDGSTTMMDYLHAFTLSECSIIRKYSK